MSTVPDPVFRAIVDRTSRPFVITDADATIRYASASVAGLVGWLPEEMVGRNLLDFLPTEQTETAVEGLAELLASDDDDPGIPVVFEVFTRDGLTTWLQVAAMAISDVGGPDVLALRLECYAAERHRAVFLRALLADAPLEDVLRPLACSIEAVFRGVGAAIHHGFDGAEFEAAVGSWPGAAMLPRGAPWSEVVAGIEVRDLTVDDTDAAPPGAAMAWLVPVVGSEAVAPAVLTVWLAEPEVPMIGHRTALAEAAGYVELALVRDAEHHRLRDLAERDPLTGVWNRASFHRHLSAALAAGEPDLAVAFCDLDGFKAVNDQHGHGAGDDLLVHAAARLRNCLRGGDELARVGGDEFTVLLRKVPDLAAADLAAAEQVAQRLVGAFDQPFTVPGGTAPLGVSVGMVLSGEGATAESLLMAADAALYESKRAGGGRFAVAS